MPSYILKRVAGALAVLVVMTLVIFIVLQRLVPGNEATVLAGARSATPAQVHAIEQKLGLTQPILVQYWHWLTRVLGGSFGVSPISGRSIGSVIAQEAPLSLELGALSLLVATIFGVPLGVAAARRAGRASEWAMRVPFLVLFGIPFFVSGSLLLFASARWFPSFYSASYVPITVSITGNLQSLLLPIVGTSLSITAMIAQMTRAAMLDVLDHPYMFHADCIGMRPFKKLYLFGLKAGLPSIMALEGFTFGVLIGSLIIVEDVFSLPGLGRGVLDAFGNRDFMELDAQVVVLAAAFIVGNLLVDIGLPIVDKRLLRH